MPEQTKGAPSDATAIMIHPHFDSAQLFLEALRPGLMRWHEGKCVFRGQAQDWPLLPSAHRYERWKAYAGFMQTLRVFGREGVHPGYVLDEAAEDALLRRFHEIIDGAGLAVPQHNLPFENMGGRTMFGGLWQPERVPLIALAQHHGIPTRLLDWTRRPMVAAYFAARQAVEEQGDAPMVLWALRTDFFKHDPIGSHALNAYVQLVTAPRASNPNLHAQAGVFTLLHQVSEVRTLDEFLLEWSKASGVASDYFPLMHKFTVAKREARRVLVRVAHEGISASALFPGYDGAAREVKERTLLGDPLPTDSEADDGN